MFCFCIGEKDEGVGLGYGLRELKAEMAAGVIGVLSDGESRSSICNQIYIC